MAVAAKTVRYAKAILEKRRAILEQIGGPYPLAGLALMVAQESGGNVNAITSQAGPNGFWEVGYTLRTVAKVNGTGTARDANIDPLDAVSSLYGAQLEAWEALEEWRTWLPAHGFDWPEPDDVGEWLILMRFPYSVGWKAAKLILQAGHKHGRIIEGDPSGALRRALELPDDKLPDPGPQTDDKIRLRIHRALELVNDAELVGDIPGALFPEAPTRIPAVKPWPRFFGAGGLQSRLRLMAQAKHLAP